LLAGLFSGELCRRLLKLPRITGYLLTGMALGPGVFDLLDEQMLEDASLVLDIALGLILYELGSRLDLRWLRRNPWLLLTSVAESAFSFALVVVALTWQSIAPLHAAVAAAIGIGSSPSVLLLVIRDERADGPLAEQAVNLTALNNIFAVVTVTMLLAYVHLEYRAGLHVMLLHPLYLLLGALALGYAASLVTLLLAAWLGKREELQFMLLVAVILLTVGAALALHVSVLLTLLALGVFARNRDRWGVLLPVEFGPTAQFFFVALLVLTGAHLDWLGLPVLGGAALAYVAARVLGKVLGIVLFAPLTGLRPRKAGLLGLTLTPMAAVAVMLVQVTSEVYPEFGVDLAAIVLSAVVTFALLGPVVVQWALRLAGEARVAEVTR
jgi:NhaP-type Na+/H+ or K+/H+ antiporter